MTERQKALIENLPKCDYMINKAGIKAGYSESYANSKLYQKVRQGKIAGIESDEKVKEKYLKKVRKYQRKMLNEGDNTNLSRTTELEGRVLGVTKDTVRHEGDVPQNIVVNYGSKVGRVGGGERNENRDITHPQVKPNFQNHLPKSNDGNKLQKDNEVNNSNDSGNSKEGNVDAQDEGNKSS